MAPESSVQAPWDYRLARGVAYLASPIIFPPVLFAAVLLHFGAAPTEIMWVLAITFVFFIAIPVGYALWMVRQRQASSLEMPRRGPRTRIFGVGLVSYLAALLLTAVATQTATRLLVALMGCYVLNTLLILCVNLYWKISAHVSAGAGFFAMLLFVRNHPWSTSSPADALLPLGAYLLLLGLVPLLMWARVRTGSHTLGQVAAGAVVGALAPCLELYLFDYLGLFAGL